MTQFAGTTAIGGVSIIVEYDQSKMGQQEQAIRSRISKFEQSNRTKFQLAPTASQTSLPASAAMSGGGGGRGRGGPVWTGGGAGSGGGGYAPASGGRPAAELSGGGGSGGGGGGRGVNRDVNFMRGAARVGTLYGAASIVESGLQVATALNEASKNMKAAVNNTMAIKAQVEGRQAAESGLRQVPIFGGLAAAGRNAFDSFFNMGTQGDIDRNSTQAAMTSEFNQNVSDRSSARSVAHARNSLAISNAFAPNMSRGAELNLIKTERQAAEKKIRDERQLDINKYAFNEQSPITSETYQLYKSRSHRLPSENSAIKSYDEWQQKNQASSDQSKYLHGLADRDVAESNRGFRAQALERLMGGRQSGQSINPFDAGGMGMNSVNNSDTIGQDPRVLKHLQLMADRMASDQPALTATGMP